VVLPASTIMPSSVELDTFVAVVSSFSNMVGAWPVRPCQPSG
jgi:hypothetical protein